MAEIIREDTPDALWNATVVKLFDQGALQLSFKKDGSPFEVW